MKRLVILCICLCGLVGTSAFGQFNTDQQEFLFSKGMSAFPLRVPFAFDFVGAGTRAKGMGNAFLAISDDVSAVTWNPAGLYGQERAVVGFSYGSYQPKGSFEAGRVSQFASQASDLSETFGGVSLLSFTAPIRIQGHPFVIAASYSRAADEYDYYGVNAKDTQEFLKPDGTIDQMYINVDLTADYSSRVDVVNFGFGTKVQSNMSAGATVNIYTNKSVSMQDQFTTIDNIYLDDQAQTVEDNLSALDTSWYSGVNFTLGWKYTADMFSLGAIVKTPFSLEHKTNRTVHQVIWINGLEMENQVIHFDRILTQIEMPLIIGVGGAYRVTEELMVAADIEYRRFAGQKIKLRERYEIVPGEKDREEFSIHDPRWKDVIAMRVGAEYAWETGSSLFPTVPLRAGFSYTPIPTVALWDRYGYIPIADPTQYDLTWDQVTSNEKATIVSFSGGVGVKWSEIYFDLAYTYSTLEHDYGRINATTKVDASNLALTFTGYF